MTMPQMMNCSHASSGWCLDCVRAELAALRLELQAAKEQVKQQSGEVDRLRKRTHEIAEREGAKAGKAESELYHLKKDLAWARDWYEKIGGDPKRLSRFTENMIADFQHSQCLLEAELRAAQEAGAAERETRVKAEERVKELGVLIVKLANEVSIDQVVFHLGTEADAIIAAERDKRVKELEDVILEVTDLGPIQPKKPKQKLFDVACAILSRRSKEESR